MARQMQEEEWRIREQDEQDMLVAMLVAQQLDEEERARGRMSLAAAAGNGEWVRRPLEVVGASSIMRIASRTATTRC